MNIINIMNHSDTIFTGYFKLDKPLKVCQTYYLNKFLGMRHMGRVIESLPPDPILNIVNLPFGDEGEFYIASKFRDNIPLWTPDTNYLFRSEFKRIVFMLICIQKYYFPDFDKYLFYNIIQYLSRDVYTRDFDYTQNLSYLYICDDDYAEIESIPNSSPHIIDHNKPPCSQPTLYCKWIINEEGTIIRWNGHHKFPSHIRWIVYIIEKFLIHWGYKLSGEITYQGHDELNQGSIVIQNNIVKIISSYDSEYPGTIIYGSDL